MAIEVDGLGHDFEASAQRDRNRDRWVREQGIETLRIAAEDVRTNLEGSVAQIVNICLERTPLPHSAQSPSPPNSGEDETR